MKYILFSLCIAIWSVGSAQNGPIKIHLKSGETLSTNYVYLTNGSLSPAFVRIGTKKGEKITIDKIDYIDGIDQQGVYRYFKGMKYSASQVWGERNYTSDRIEIYYVDIHYIGSAGNTTYKSKYYRYSKDHGPLQKLSYANVKRDLYDCAATVPYLKKANGIRMIQDVLYLGSAALMVGGISSDLSANDGSISATVIAGAGGLIVASLLDGPKRNRFVDALKVYK